MRFGASNRSMSLAMLAITLLSLALNSLGLKWDRGLYLHPDERFVIWLTSDLRWPDSIGQYFDTANSPLNPYNTQHNTFVYGTFPPFLMKSIAGLFDMDSYSEMYVVGRWVSAVAAAATVLLTMVIARRFVSDRGALLSGFLMAFSPMLMQSAHFATVDSVAVFLVVAVFAATLHAWERKSLSWVILAGVLVGLAGASKPNYLLTAFFVGLPVLEQIRVRGWASLLRLKSRDEYPAVLGTLGAGLAAIFTFRVAQPYAFAGPHFWSIRINQEWMNDLSWWQGLLQRGLVDYKPMVQWADRTPVLYITSNLVFWAMGAAVGLAALVALVLAAVRLLQSDSWPSWWSIGLVGWCGGHLVFYGAGLAQNQRYLMSIQPFLYILAAWLLWQLVDHFPRQRIGYAVMAVVTVYTVLYGVAFASIWTQTNTRIEASEWIYQNVPAGSMISSEYWDDSLPMPLPGYNRSAYGYMTIDLYADEMADDSKVTTLVGQLSQVDYIVLSSNRVIDSVARQPERYPITNRFYEMLLSGELGFVEVKDYTRAPSIFGIEWNDLAAEESLLVYDHPQVRIFQKTDGFSAQTVYNELNAAWDGGGLHYIPGDPTPGQMLMSDEDIATSVERGSWSDQFSDGFVQRHPLLFWGLAMQVLGLIAWPMTWRLFRSLPDAGAALAKGVGVLAMAAITLGLVCWGGLPFARGTILFSILILALIGGLSLYRKASGFAADMRARQRSILIGECVFALAFILVGGLRGWQQVLPDVEVAQFTSVMRSSTLPPIDLWFGGGVLHTYWSAVLPWTAIGRLLGIEPIVAFSVSIAAAVALTATLVWSIVHTLTRSWLAIVAVVLVVAGSGRGFTEGLASQWFRYDVSFSMLAMLPLVALVMLTLTGIQNRSVAVLANKLDRDSGSILAAARSTPTSDHAVHSGGLILAALAAGAVIASAEWGTIVAIGLLAIGLGVPALQSRIDSDPWWPAVRRYVLELVAILGFGVVIWYPAISSHTATFRNLTAPTAWTIDHLIAMIGAMLFLSLLLMTFGASAALGETMREGWIGVVTTCIAAAVIVLLITVAIVADSALLIIVVVSMLSLTALWYWLREPLMQWSVALTLLGATLLTYAQVRPAHTDINGRIVTGQFFPLVWMLLVIGVVIGAFHLFESIPRTQRRLAAITVVLITALLVSPTIANVRDVAAISDWSPSQPSVVSVSDTDLAAAEWLQDQSGMPVILALPDAHTGMITVAGQPSVLVSTSFAYRTRPGWERLVERRRADISTIYTSLADWETVGPLLDRYHVKFIVVGSAERLQMGPDLDSSLQMAVISGNLEIAWQRDDLTIYRVVQP